MTTDDVTSRGWIMAGWIAHIWNLFTIPLYLHYVMVYYSKRDRTFFASRMPMASITLSVYKISILFHRAALACVGMGFIPNYWFLTTFLGFLEWFPLFFIFIYKAWFSIYQYLRNQVSSDNGWRILLLLGTTKPGAAAKAMIDADGTNDAQVKRYFSHYTIRFANTLGSYKLVARALYIVCACIMVPLAVLMLLREFFWKPDGLWVGLLVYYANTLVAGMGAVVVPIAVMVTVSRFTDMVYIKNELIGICVSLTLFPVSQGLWSLYVSLTGKTFDSHVFFYVAVTFAFQISLFYLLIYVLHKYNPKLTFLHKLLKLCNCSIAQSEESRDVASRKSGISVLSGSGANSPSPSVSGPRRVDLNDVISHEIGFKVFLRFLVRLYAVESLLFYVEMIAFKYESKVFDGINENVGVGVMHAGDTTPRAPFPRLTSKIPQSNIMKEANVYKRIYLIMERYIVPSAKLQINISSHQRKDLFAQMRSLVAPGLNRTENQTDLQLDEEELKRLYVFFDDAGREALYLLRRSFRRFRETKEFERLEGEMTKGQFWA